MRYYLSGLDRVCFLRVVLLVAVEVDYCKVPAILRNKGMLLVLRLKPIDLVWLETIF